MNYLLGRIEKSTEHPLLSYSIKKGRANMTLGWRNCDEMIANISTEVPEDDMLEPCQFSWIPSEIALISKWTKEQKELTGDLNSRTITNSLPDAADPTTDTNNTVITNSPSNSNMDHRELDTMHMQLRSNRRPPIRYVARPSIFGFTNEEADQHFLNEDGCTPNRRQRHRSTPNADNLAPKVLSLTDFGLHTDEDLKHINPAHCLIRSEIIESFFYDGTPSQQGLHFIPKQGQVGFQCKYCKDLKNDKRKKFHSVYPQSIGGIYRSIIVRLQRHIR
jgi:hypothetical protein